jgi:hypothetical protein
MIYELLQSDTAKELEVKINERLGDGWELYGNLVTAIKPESSEVRLEAEWLLAWKVK